MRMPRPWPVRVTHWIAVPAMILLAISGLQIFLAYPHFGPAARPWNLPLERGIPPEAAPAGRGIAAGPGIPFLIAWLVAGNALVYLVNVLASGEYRRRAAHGFYNALQRAAYASAILLCIVEVWSGLVIYKPVQTHALAVPLGGCEGARAVHFFGLVALVFFAIGQIVMVLRDPRGGRA